MHKFSMRDLIMGKLWRCLLAAVVGATSLGMQVASAGVEVSLPAELPAAPGVRCAVYFRNVTDAERPEDYDVRVVCEVGSSDGRAWTWMPEERDAGRRIPLFLSFASEGAVVASTTTCVAVAALPVDRSRPFSLALLGDSLTNCRYQDRLLERMREAGFTGYRAVGSRTGYSAAPVGEFEPGQAAHDGYGGYSWASFLKTYALTPNELDNIQAESERRQLEEDGVKIDAGTGWRRNLLKSPLVRLEKGRKVVDVQRWFDSVNAGAAPDVILIALGSNDVFYRNRDGRNREGKDVCAQVSQNIDALLDVLRAAAPTSMIVLATAPTGGRQSGFTANYGTFRTASDFRASALAYNRLIAGKLAVRKDPRMTILPIHHAIDFEKGYLDDNALHPNSAGGRMIADALYAGLVGWLDEEYRKPAAGATRIDHRPYEFRNARRDADEVAPFEDFETAAGGWRAEALDGGTAVARTTDERQLFGERTLAVEYRGTPTLRVRPAAPIAIPARHEWFSAWIWNDQLNYGVAKYDGAGYGLVFVDANGTETWMPFRSYGYDKNLYWTEWTWMTKRFSAAERALLEKPGVRFDGFYVSGATNDVSRRLYFDNLAFFDTGDVPKVALMSLPPPIPPTRTEGAAPLSGEAGTAKAEGVETADGRVFLYEGTDGRLEYFWRGEPSTLEASWNGGPRFRPAALSGARRFPAKAAYSARLLGKTLVVDVSAPAGEEYVSMGCVQGAKVLDEIVLPVLADGYEWENSRSLVKLVDDGCSRFFTLTFADWYRTKCSRFGNTQEVDGTITNRAAWYLPKTDGRRNPVSERLYVTVASDLRETLPVVANPPAEYHREAAERAWCAYAGSSEREFDKSFWRRLHDLGLRKVAIGDHECCWRDGGESFTQRLDAAPGKGGDRGLKDYVEYLVNTLGYRYGIYNNFTDYAPVNAEWRFGRAARTTPEPIFTCGGPVGFSGGLKPAWMRCYAPKPQWALEACERFTPRIKAKFGVNTAYCDVHTAVDPWEYVDYDAACEGAGEMASVYNVYRHILLCQKRNWKGPVYSEGGCQFYYAGFTDGNYGQLRMNPEKDRWIVDFELEQVHPLESDFGCGNLAMFASPVPKQGRELDAFVDRFNAATLAFGHAAYLPIETMFDPMSAHAFGYPSKSRRYVPERGTPYLLRSYYMVRAASERYWNAKAEEIRYLGTDGEWRGVSDAVKSGDRRMNRIAVKYSNGMRVVVNGDRELRLKAAAFGRAVDLPPGGFVVWNEDGSFFAESSDRLGYRFDYAEGDGFVFLDTRDGKVPAELPRASGRGRAVRYRDAQGVWHKRTLAGEVLFEGEAVELIPGRAEVVIAPDAPKSVRFAADEMTNFLSRTFCREVPVVTAPTVGKGSIFLGVNEWSKTAGLDPAKLPRDSFEIKAVDGKVFIAGVDDPKQDWAALVRAGFLAGRPGSVRDGERGTLFGVYEFLYRFCGCRFYFPGELGEVVPRKDRIEVPCGKFACSPSYAVRDIYLSGDGAWPGAKSVTEANRVKALDWLRLRLQTESVPCCHGINNFQLADRFGAMHPEWFCLRKNPATGKFERSSGAGSTQYGEKGHLCFSNDEMWDQVLKDTIAYHQGKKAQEVGIKPIWCSGSDGWGPSPSGRFVDVMAQDGMQECFCDKCQAAYEKEKGVGGYASELIWMKTARFARGLSSAGVPMIVTQMAYSPYSTVPKCEIPSNVWVMVKAEGPWSVGNPSQYRRDLDFVRAWVDKLGHKVWLWTYPAKHPAFELGMKGPPDYAPRATYRFFKDTMAFSEGAFAESESENSLIHYMNYYVFSRLAWSPDLDLDELLSEHYALMYGAAAKPMAEAFELFEKKWIGEIAGNVIDTPLGPQPRAPSQPELWTKVWDKASIVRVKALFAEAATLVSADSLEARRIALMKEVFLDELVTVAEANLAAMDVKAAQARRAKNPPKNLLANGAFDPDGGGWQMPVGLNGYDTSTFVSPPASFRVRNLDGKGWSCCSQLLPDKLKDDTTYRISFFVKLDDVQRLNQIGHSCWAISYYESWHCKPAGGQGDAFHLGTCDWIYYEGTFKTGKRNPADKNQPRFDWGFNGEVTGTAWIDDVVLEEVEVEKR